MQQINCYIPIKLRVTGRPSDAQLIQLEEQLVSALLGRISFAERATSPGRYDRSRDRAEEIVRDSYDPSRESVNANLYSIPSYDDGETTNVRIQGQTSQGQANTSLSLAIFADLETVYAHITRFYPDPQPRGNTMFGVYGIWADDMLPQIFYVSGTVQEGAYQGQPFIRGTPIVGGRLENGRFVPREPGNIPMAVELDERYRLQVLAAPRTRGNVTINATLHRDSGEELRPVFLTESAHLQLRGKTIRFGVASDIVFEITVRAPAPAAGASRRPPWYLWYGTRSLPAQPDAGIPDWLWWWYGWFNVRPAEVRANPLVRAVFRAWQQGGGRDDFNPLFLHIYRGQFYRAFCRLVALQMLARSRQNMQSFLTWLGRNEAQWKRRFATLVQTLAEPARLLRDVRQLPILRLQLQSTENLIEQQRLFGSLPGGMVSEEDAAHLRERIRRAEEVAGEGEEVEGISSLLQLAQEMEPLLAILTIREGQTTSLEEAIAWMADQHPDYLMRHVRGQMQWLIQKTHEAEREIQNDEGVAYRLRFVQEEANRQLADWLQGDRLFRQSVERTISGPGILAWLGIGIALLILIFVFPPLGIGLSAALSVTLAASSVRRAMQMSRLSHVRLAQFGFRPLVSEAEVNAAIFQASVDVFFAALDIGVVAAAAGRPLRTLVLGARLERTAAQRIAGAVGHSLERIIIGWRRFDLWPDELTQLLRRRIIEQLDRARPAWRTGLTIEQSTRQIDDLLQVTQRELVVRYEQRLLQFQDRFQRTLTGLEAGEAMDIQAWLAREFPNGSDFFTRLVQRELRPGQSLFENTLGRHLAGLPPLPRPRAIEFLRDLTEAELQTLTRELGNMAELLNPNRLFPLGRSANMDYPTLARMLRGILQRVEGPEQVLTRLESLLVGRRDAGVFLNTLEHIPNPRSVLNALNPEMLNAQMTGGFHELFDAMSRTSRHGEVVRFISDLDQQGVRRLFREVRRPNGSSFFQRWGGLVDDWVPEARIRVPPSPAAPQAAITSAERAAAIDRLQQRAAARTAAGRPTAAARRISSTLGEIQMHPASQQMLEQIGNVAVREGDEIAAGLLEGLASLSGRPTAGQMQAVVDFLRRGGEGRALGVIFSSAGRLSPGRGRVVQQQIQRFLDVLPSFQANELRGISVVMAERGYERRGAEAVLSILDNYSSPRQVFGALSDLAPHSDGLRRVIGNLASLDQNLNRAALGQLMAARRLLEEFPGRRIAFEVPVQRGRQLIREIDVQVVTPYTRVPLLEAELKEVTSLFTLGTEHVRQQFARDIVRSVHAARPGQEPLSSIRWLVREQELLQSGMTREQLRAQIKEQLRQAFTHQELNALSPAQRQAALSDFEGNFERILQLF